MTDTADLKVGLFDKRTREEDEIWDSSMDYEYYNALVAIIEQVIQQPFPWFLATFSDLVFQVQQSIGQLFKRCQTQFNLQNQPYDVFTNQQNQQVFNYKDLNTPFSCQVQPCKDLDNFKVSQTPPSSSQELTNFSFEQDTPKSDISSIITSNSQSSVNLNLGTLNTNQVLQQYQAGQNENIGYLQQGPLPVQEYSCSTGKIPVFQERRQPSSSHILSEKDIWSVAIVSRDQKGNNILHHIAKQGNVGLANFVTQYTQNMLLEEVNLDGNTPLLVAAKYGQQSMVQYLLSIGANYEAQNTYGIRMVHYGAALFDAQFFKQICLQYNLTHYLRSAQGSPLHFAVAEGNVENLKTLIELQSDVNIIDVDGVTPLMAAVMAGKNQSAIQLLKQNFDHQLAHVPGTSANIVHVCCELDLQDVCKELISKDPGLAKRQCLEQHRGLKAAHIASLMDNSTMLEMVWPYSDLGQHTSESLREEAEKLQFSRDNDLDDGYELK